MNRPDQPDYPAAHSMDTWWFAVDERGAVAVFDTNENGPVAANSDLRQTGAAIEDLLGSGPRGTRLEDWYASRGITYYEYSDDHGGLVRLYERLRAPTGPLFHVDQLPLALARRCRSVCYVGARFDRARSLQPIEFFDCQLYSEISQVAYVTGDGVTVRPFPDREGEFAEFVAGYRERNPESSGELRFEGETD
jgi:hypothetical protein